jgi:hypothetical protein
MHATTISNEAATRTVGIADGILLASWTGAYALLLFGFQILRSLERVFAKREVKEPIAEGGKRFRGDEG